jgi:hypothetical protein
MPLPGTGFEIITLPLHLRMKKVDNSVDHCTFRFYLIRAFPSVFSHLESSASSLNPGQSGTPSFLRLYLSGGHDGYRDSRDYPTRCQAIADTRYSNNLSENDPAGRTWYFVLLPRLTPAESNFSDVPLNQIST